MMFIRNWLSTLQCVRFGLSEVMDATEWLGFDWKGFLHFREISTIILVLPGPEGFRDSPDHAW